jgi:MOSC domain-containing protein YiiM
LNVPQGTVVSLFVGTAPGESLSAVQEARAVPGKGLEGDRYFLGQGTFSTSEPQPDHELTFIEIESLEALKREYGIDLQPHESRRNILTRSVSLNHLVGQEFKVGEVSVRGIRLCEPCSHLQGLTQEGVLKGLIHRGGLRAQILTVGVIRVGDAVVSS